MERTDAIEVEALVTEIQRYLEVVEAFRREGYEPKWCSRPRPERNRTAVKP
jgi:hypothetical protein